MNEKDTFWEEIESQIGPVSDRIKRILSWQGFCLDALPRLQNSQIFATIEKQISSLNEEETKQIVGTFSGQPFRFLQGEKCTLDSIGSKSILVKQVSAPRLYESEDMIWEEIESKIGPISDRIKRILSWQGFCVDALSWLGGQQVVTAIEKEISSLNEEESKNIMGMQCEKPFCFLKGEKSTLTSIGENAKSSVMQKSVRRSNESEDPIWQLLTNEIGPIPDRVVRVLSWQGFCYQTLGSLKQFSVIDKIQEDLNFRADFNEEILGENLNRSRLLRQGERCTMNAIGEIITAKTASWFIERIKEENVKRSIQSLAINAPLKVDTDLL